MEPGTRTFDHDEARRKILATIQRVPGPLPDPCWITTQSTDRDGYGVIKLGNWPFRKHRVAYRVFIGPIPESLVTDHLCRVRSCCNPRHIEPVTNRENLLRGETLNATNAAKTHCIRGHPLSGPNLYVTTAGKRNCRKCIRLSQERTRG